MLDPDPRPSSGGWRLVWDVILEGICAYHHAHYPSAMTTAFLENLQDRRLRSNPDAANADTQLLSGRPRPRYWRHDLQHGITKLLRTPMMAWLARVLLTLPFWSSGLSKLFLFDDGVAEMARVGLEPAAGFNIATIFVQLAGSGLIIVNRATWLGAGALGVFTGLTILLVHRFWAISEEPFRTIALHVSSEHVGMIGGLLAVAILSARRDAAEPAPHAHAVQRRPAHR
ncbi:DoxX family protein [Sphingomonas trueperi]|uniref:DoxX family protein n=1 Tax=Sphingomonas trueperi TaxID=53317 RepID=UPI00339521F0